MIRKSICFLLPWFSALLLWNCQPGQPQRVSEQGSDTTKTIRSKQNERAGMEDKTLDTEGERAAQVPDGFKQFIDFLPEWTGDTIRTGDIFNYDADMAPEYAERFEMRNKFEEKESVDVSPLFLYKITLDNCYVIFVEKETWGCPTADGFYAGRRTHAMMTCTKGGQMIEKVDLGNHFIGHRGFCHIRGTRSPLRLEVKNVYYVVGNGEKWRAPQPSRICQIEYRVDPKNGHISQDTLAIYDCDRYIGKQGQSIWKNLTERMEKSHRKGNATANAYRRPQTIEEWIDCFPEWTADSISEHIFDATGIVSEEVVFPKEFRPVAEQDSARQQIIEMRYGHRITTDSLHILFARKICRQRNRSDSLVPESFFTQTVMVYSHDGQLRDWYDVTRNFPSTNRTHVSGCKSPFRLHVKTVELLKHDYEHTHYIPVCYRDIEWRVAQEGILTTDTLMEEKCRWYPYKHPGVCEPWYEQLSPL
ncbi:MAG: hypothetical protein J1F27_01255 [Prevotellaceae bacterium]|nr:hypothetical protein [Prevotellaceae bacterium]